MNTEIRIASKEQKELESLNERIHEFGQSYIDCQNRLTRAKEHWEAKKTDIKTEVAFDEALTNDARRKAREKELLREADSVNMERAVENLELECQRHQLQIEYLKRLFNIYTIRFKNLLGVTDAI